jgi:hypothetical protein
MQKAAIDGASPCWNLNFFHRSKEKPTEESQPSVQPPPLPKIGSDPVRPIQINDEEYVLLLKALHPRDKTGRVLKDLPVDELKAKAVVGAASQTPPANPPPISSPESPGPIV